MNRCESTGSRGQLGTPNMFLIRLLIDTSVSLMVDVSTGWSASWWMDSDYRALTWTPSMMGLFGVPADGWIGKNLFDFVHPTSTMDLQFALATMSEDTKRCQVSFNNGVQCVLVLKNVRFPGQSSSAILCSVLRLPTVTSVVGSGEHTPSGRIDGESATSSHSRDEDEGESDKSPTTVYSGVGSHHPLRIPSSESCTATRDTVGVERELNSSFPLAAVDRAKILSHVGHELGTPMQGMMGLLHRLEDMTKRNSADTSTWKGEAAGIVDDMLVLSETMSNRIQSIRKVGENLSDKLAQVDPVENIRRAIRVHKSVKQSHGAGVLLNEVALKKIETFGSCIIKGEGSMFTLVLIHLLRCMSQSLEDFKISTIVRPAQDSVLEEGLGNGLEVSHLLNVELCAKHKFKSPARRRTPRPVSGPPTHGRSYWMQDRDEFQVTNHLVKHMGGWIEVNSMYRSISATIPVHMTGSYRPARSTSDRGLSASGNMASTEQHAASVLPPLPQVPGLAASSRSDLPHTPLVRSMTGLSPQCSAKQLERPRLTGRALIVEDNLAAAKFILNALSGTGVETAHATDGIEAVQMFEKSLGQCQAFDLITMDLQMPRMSGQEAVRSIRAMENDHGFKRKTPIVVISGNNEGDVHGADKVYEKPMRRETIYNVARTYLQVRA